MEVEVEDEVRRKSWKGEEEEEENRSRLEMTNEVLLVLSLFLSQRPTLRAYLSLANLVGIAFFRRFDVSRGHLSS